MKERFFKMLCVGAFEVNCYLIPVPEEETLYILDPGGDAADIISLAESFSLKRGVILLTHAHADHIIAAGPVAKALNAQLFLHPGDLEMYRSPENEFLPWLPHAENLPEPAVWQPQSKAFRILETPGHTQGGVCYYFPEQKALFSGDTLFRESVGRTDLPGGDQEQLTQSIREMLLTLPDDTEVFPGHGYPTQIGFERENNPYL